MKKIRVSNPWREAIEDWYSVRSEIAEMFPILGGRLLKDSLFKKNKSLLAFPILGGRLLKLLLKWEASHGNGFQSLEGGY